MVRYRYGIRFNVFFGFFLFEYVLVGGGFLNDYEGGEGFFWSFRSIGFVIGGKV